MPTPKLLWASSKECFPSSSQYIDIYKLLATLYGLESSCTSYPSISVLSPNLVIDLDDSDLDDDSLSLSCPGCDCPRESCQCQHIQQVHLQVNMQL